jgi:hypothetical protein
MGLIGLLVSEELGAFLTTLKIRLLFLFLGLLLLLTHNDLIFKKSAE